MNNQKIVSIQLSEIEVDKLTELKTNLGWSTSAVLRAGLKALYEAELGNTLTRQKIELRARTPIDKPKRVTQSELTELRKAKVDEMMRTWTDEQLTAEFIRIGEFPVAGPGDPEFQYVVETDGTGYRTVAIYQGQSRSTDDIQKYFARSAKNKKLLEQ